MPGTGGIHFARPDVEFWYDPSEGDPDEPVTVTFVNADNGDVGQKKDKNDGLVAASYSNGFEGEDHVIVTSDATGEAIAEFDTGFFKVAGGLEPGGD